MLALPDALHRFELLRLQKRFASYPLSKFGAETQKAVDVVQSLIDSGELNATLNPSDEDVVVRFIHDKSSGPLAQTEMQMQQALARQLLHTKQLLDEVSFADNKAILTREYVQTIARQRADASRLDSFRGAGSILAAGDTQPLDALDLPVSSDAQDEDLMQT